MDVQGGGEEKVARVRLELQERQWSYLTRLTEQIHRATGAVLRPEEVIRALVEALSEAAPVTPARINGEEDLVDLFYRRFTQQEDRPHDRERMRF